MTSRTSFAPGKIILSGEYAVLFGYSGIAVPSTGGIKVTFENNPSSNHMEINWMGSGNEQGSRYAEKVAALCGREGMFRGRLDIGSNLPIGKGMGSSTALIIAITRALLGKDEREAAFRIEDELNPGHSGLDFTTIWNAGPVLFNKDTGAKPIALPHLLDEATLIDTGLPNESTTELVAWMRGRKGEIGETLKTIGDCTERLLKGESLDAVMRDHHKAQVALGVVPQEVQDLISAIESEGGAGKVVGAGSRTGGAGIVLAVGNREEIVKIASQRSMPTMEL